jgi:hypothetical protein
MSIHRIKDEAVVQTLVYINEIARCNCRCHGGAGLLDDNCCRYPGWWPSAPSIQEALLKIRGERCPHCGVRVRRVLSARYLRVFCDCGYSMRSPAPAPRIFTFTVD